MINYKSLCIIRKLKGSKHMNLHMGHLRLICLNVDRAEIITGCLQVTFIEYPRVHSELISAVYFNLHVIDDCEFLYILIPLTHW